MRPAWGLDGPDRRPEKSGLAEALRMAHATPRVPTERDAPPPSTFPKTPAAREALRIFKQQGNVFP